MTANTQPIADPFAETQNNILNTLLIGICVFGIIRLSGPIASIIRSGTVETINIIFISILVPLLIASLFTAIRKNLAYKVRAAIFLITLYIFGLQDTIVERLAAGNGLLILIVFIVLTIVLTNVRLGLLATVLVLSSMWVINFTSGGTNTTDLIQFYVRFPGFIVPAMILFIIGGSVVLSISRLLNAIQNFLDNQQNLAMELEAEGQRLEERIQARERALQTSTSIGRQISGLLDKNEILQSAAQLITDTFNYYHIQIYSLNKNTGELLLEIATQTADQAIPQQDIVIPMGQTSIGQAGVLQQSVRSTTFNKSNAYILPHTKVEAAVPIMFEQELYGILNIQHIDPNALTEDELFSLELITEQIAVALYNANLYAQAQNLLVRQAVANEIRQKIQQTTTMEDTIQTAVAELGKILNSKRAKIKIGSQS
ncbi:MAG: GAF domain-containing protein [Anaerolineales bacterium]|nr:GAF domain-containing protein [Anaerolineales bacterium]